MSRWHKYVALQAYHGMQRAGGTGGQGTLGPKPPPWSKRGRNGGGGPTSNLDTFAYVKRGANINYTHYGLDVSPDGDYFYQVEAEGSNDAEGVILSTPWDIGTQGTVDHSTSLDVSNRYGCRIRADDGTQFWSIVGDGRIYNHTLTTPYRLTGASGNVNKLISDVAPAITATKGLYIKPDGTRIFTGNSAGTQLVELSMSTPWDLTTLGHVQTKTDFINIDDLWFTADGTRVYTQISTTVKQWNLGTAWDITTIPGTHNYSLNLGTNNANGLCLSEDTTKLYIANRGGSSQYKIWQFEG